MRKRDGERARRLALAAIAVGVVLRLVLAFVKPLWADEIFTLDLARRPLRELLHRLAVDSGPPLHYLLAKLVLLPFPRPGAGDLFVRLLSVVSGVLHVPVLLRIGRTRTGPGFVAAALYSLFPIAVYYGAEGRGYALASLLVLLAYAGALDAAERPMPAALVVGLGILIAAAFLTHYLALFPLAGLLVLLVDARRENRLRLVGSFALASLLVTPWFLVILGQPKASMAWVVPEGFGTKLARFFVNVVLGSEVSRTSLIPLFLAGLLVFAIAARAAFRAGSPMAAALAAGALLLLVSSPFLPAVLLPERSAVLFLPLSALVVAAAGEAVSLGLGIGLAALLVPAMGEWCVRTPSEELAMRLRPAAAKGDTIVAAGLWGPELRYRMARARLPGEVFLFPSDVAMHPGWYAESEATDARLNREAAALFADNARPPRFLVLPLGLRASAALRAAAPPGRLRLVARTNLFEVIEVMPERR